MKNPKNKKSEKAASKKKSSELIAPIWSVVSFEACAASNLTYAEAAEKLKNLAAKKISGLCIITDEAAERIQK